MNITNDKPIYKIGERVFRYGNFAHNKDFLNTIVSILDLGFKFVPNIFKNSFDYFNYLLHTIDSHTLEINKNLFFTKMNEIRNDERNKERSTSRVNFDEDNITQTNTKEKIDDFINIINHDNLMKKPFTLDAYPLLSESIFLRSKIFEEVSSIKFNPLRNLSKKQLMYLKKFSLGKANFKILQCDKNVGSLVISNEDFLSLVDRYFEENKQNYITLTENPLENTIDLVNRDLKKLYEQKHISKKLFNCLKAESSNRLGTLRLLPKIHKQKFGIRQINNCIKHPTEKICHFVDLFLKEIVGNLPTVLKDSQELLQKLNSPEFKSVKNNLFLYSCDFESLYTNIKPEDAIERITDFLINENLLKSKHFDHVAFKGFLRLIFNNNVFTFNSIFYLQVIGLPMGCKCGPTVANLYLYILEKNWILNNNPLIYGRFIDDIFCADKEEINTENLKSNFGYLKLNIESSRKVNFLDLIISFDKEKSEFETNLYIKPTNTYSYLLKTSNHPNHIFKNIPKSLFIRIRRICSNTFDYIYHSKNLCLQLFKRGYNYFKVRSIANAILRIKREDLLQYKNKELTKFKAKKDMKWITLFQKYDKTLLFLKQTFSNAFYKTKYYYETKSKFLKNLFLKFNFSIGTNIGSMLIHGFKNKTLEKVFFCNKCEDKYCKICPFVKKTNSLKTKNYIFPVVSNCNCKSKGIIYVIGCNRCKIYYIGESERSAEKRLSEHIKDTQNFKYNLTKALENYDKQSEVAIHFNRSFHNFKEDFEIYILDEKNNDKTKRKSKETDLINIFKKLKIPILNRKIPDPKYISAFCFFK